MSRIGDSDPKFAEGIAYAEIDVEDSIDVKLFQDIVGSYNGFDIMSLNLNRERNLPLREVRPTPIAEQETRHRDGTLGVRIGDGHVAAGAAGVEPAGFVAAGGGDAAT